MLRGMYIDPNDYDDVIQELRIRIVKAKQKWREDGGASFHTYLYHAMLNALRAYYNKTNQIKNREELVDTVPEEVFVEDKISIKSLIDGVNLTFQERMVLDFLLCGYSYRQIRKFLVDPRFLRKSIKTLKIKFAWLREK